MNEYDINLAEAHKSAALVAAAIAANPRRKPGRGPSSSAATLWDEVIADINAGRAPALARSAR